MNEIVRRCMENRRRNVESGIGSERNELMIRKITGAVLAILAMSAAPASAQEEGGDLRSAVQNPIGSLISVPFKFSFDNGAPNGKANSHV